MSNGRDDLGIWIPRRLSSLTPEEILAEIDERRKERAALLQDIAAHAPSTKPRKDKVVDLTKVAPEDALVILAVQLGVTVDELKRAIVKSTPNGS